MKTSQSLENQKKRHLKISTGILSRYTDKLMLKFIGHSIYSIIQNKARLKDVLQLSPTLLTNHKRKH